MAYGSYSSIAVGALGGEEYDTLAENLGCRVFFAGEHTTKKHPATMHGAFLSGHREVTPRPCIDLTGPSQANTNQLCRDGAVSLGWLAS